MIFGERGINSLDFWLGDIDWEAKKPLEGYDCGGSRTLMELNAAGWLLNSDSESVLVCGLKEACLGQERALLFSPRHMVGHLSINGCNARRT